MAIWMGLILPVKNKQEDLCGRSESGPGGLPRDGGEWVIISVQVFIVLYNL